MLEFENERQRAEKFGCHSGAALQGRARNPRTQAKFLVLKPVFMGFGSLAALRPRNDGDLGLFQQPAKIAVTSASIRA